MTENEKLKCELRCHYKKKRKELNINEKILRDKKICQNILSLNSYTEAHTILTYAPLKDEIDISPIAKDALSKGKKVAFPRCNDSEHTMTYHFIHNLSELKPASYGIMQPEPDSETFKILDDKKVFCLVPGLVFDLMGYRIGFGGGYYDRFFTAFEGIKAGTIYSDFIINELPHTKYDLAVDILITEKGGIKIHAD